MILATDVLLDGLALIVLVILDIGVCSVVVAVSPVLPSMVVNKQDQVGLR